MAFGEHVVGFVRSDPRLGSTRGIVARHRSEHPEHHRDAEDTVRIVGLGGPGRWRWLEIAPESSLEASESRPDCGTVFRWRSADEDVASIRGDARATGSIVGRPSGSANGGLEALTAEAR